MARGDVSRAMSAGGIVYRLGADGVEIVLVGRSREQLWALPKGTPDEGESVEETALREVREETGLEVALIEHAGDVHYSFLEGGGTRVYKVVHYFLMEPTGGDFDAHDHEHDIVDWFHIVEAERLLTHRNQLHVLRRAAELIAARNARAEVDGEAASG
jgi:8-oxo-dGTP pyrophosphatase MutT (NUDIX family)